MGIHYYFLHTLKLYRTIALALLGAVVLNNFLANSLPNTVPGWLAFGGTLGVVGVLLVMTQATLKLAKQLPEHETYQMDKVSVLLSLGTFGVTTAVYLLTGGYFNILALCAFPWMIAHLMGLSRLSKCLLVALAGLVAACVPFHYPNLVPALGHLPPTGLWTLVSLLPVMAAAYHFISIVTTSVRTVSSRMEKLQSLAATDTLTGLINRRQFNNRLLGEISRSRRHHIPLCLVLFDIDNFKKINDFYGHQTGDRILKELGQLVIQNTRDSDVAARYGGEEFALILPETRLAEAQELMERLREMVARHVFCLPDNPLPVTISVGVSQLDPANHTAFELVEQTDAALYEAKHQGKNRVCLGITTPHGAKKQMSHQTLYEEPEQRGPHLPPQFIERPSAPAYRDWTP